MIQTYCMKWKRSWPPAVLMYIGNKRDCKKQSSINLNVQDSTSRIFFDSCINLLATNLWYVTAVKWDPRLGWTSWGQISRTGCLLCSYLLTAISAVCLETAYCDHGQERTIHSLEEGGRTQLLENYFTLHSTGRVEGKSVSYSSLLLKL